MLSAWCESFSLRWLLLLRGTGSSHRSSMVLVLSCSETCVPCTGRWTLHHRTAPGAQCRLLSWGGGEEEGEGRQDYEYSFEKERGNL